MKSVKIIFLIFSIFFLVNCKKAEENERITKHIDVAFTIPTSNQNWFRDGAIYKDNYLVWSQDESGNRMLTCYNLTSHQVSWEHDYNQVWGWGQKMEIYNNILVSDKDDLGLSIFNLEETELITKVRYDSFPNFTSHTPATFFGGKVYKSILDPYNGFSTIISIDVENGQVNHEFQWTESSDKKEELSSPLVYYNENSQKTNFIVMLQLDSQNNDPNHFSSTYLVNLNENYEVNWIDTIKNTSSLISFLPVIVDNDIILNYEGLLISTNKNTGERNWTRMSSQSNGGNFTKLIHINADTYINYGLSQIRFAKIDTSSGINLWVQNIMQPPSHFGDFEVVNDEIIYVSNNFGYINVMNNRNGNSIESNSRNIGKVANPKYLKSKDLFVTHTVDEIIGLKIE